MVAPVTVSMTTDIWIMLFAWTVHVTVTTRIAQTMKAANKNGRRKDGRNVMIDATAENTYRVVTMALQNE